MTKWVLEKNGKEILSQIEYSTRDYGIHGVPGVLGLLIPPEMTLEAEKGEWDCFGYTWRYKGDTYTIRTLEQN